MRGTFPFDLWGQRGETPSMNAIPRNRTMNPKDESGVILYSDPKGGATIRLRARDGSVWLSQADIAELFGTSKQNVAYHISNILKDKELEENSVVKYYLTTGADGKRYDVKYYPLEMILAVGFRVRGTRGTLFRKWANLRLREYLVKGFAIDDERLKNPDGRPDYFDELLKRIRDVRASEKRFYQKIRDLFALSSDYVAGDKRTDMFFAEIQNKLLFAVTGKTAAELIVARADPTAPNMGLTSWSGERVRSEDVIVAKNYLKDDELDELNRLVVIFLDQAEFRAKNRRDLTMTFWRQNAVRFLQFSDRPVLMDKGSVSRDEMTRVARERYAAFNDRRKKEEARLADLEDQRLLENLAKRVEGRAKDEKEDL